MKNIHILPTDKPSRVFITKDEGLGFDNQMLENTELDCQNQNIYITNSEEIKEGDWIYGLFNGGVILKSEFNIPKNTQYYKEYGLKIIMTTDQDLIKDGVQAIDDEFLEWFVKNPSCESVEVLRYKSNNMRKMNLGYKPIIPKEEPINPNNQEVMFHQEHKEYFYEDIINGKLVTVWLGKNYIPKEEPKQETLEEAAREYYKRGQLGFERAADTEIAFLRGGLWQSERSYSEEEVELLLETLSKVLVYQGNDYRLPHYFEFEIQQVIEQFKKK